MFPRCCMYSRVKFVVETVPGPKAIPISWDWTIFDLLVSGMALTAQMSPMLPASYCTLVR